MSAFGPAALSAAGRPSAADAAALSVLVRDSVASGQARQVLHVRLAALAPLLQRGHHHRLVREALDPLLRASRARLFALPNGDLVVVGPEQGRHLDDAAAQLAVLLGVDTGGAGAPGRTPFALLRLPAQAAAMLAALEAALEPEAVPPAEDAGRPAWGGRPAAAPGRASPGDSVGAGDAAAAAALPPGGLARVLAGASIAAFLRCRPVVRIAPGNAAPPATEWMEWRIATQELAAALRGAAPAGGPAAATLRAGPLRVLLDRRLLAELGRAEEARGRGAIGLALGLAAIASAEFHRFDQCLGPEARAQVVIGLRASEVLADPLGFRAARRALSGRGYRLALDVEDPADLALLPRDRLGVEIARLRADPGALGAAGIRLPAAWPGEAVVLAGAHRAALVGWGWEAGITRFEGRLFRG